MAQTTGPIVAVGAITFANRSILHNEPIDIRIPVATGFAAMAFALLERANQRLATGAAWIALLTVLFARLDPKVPAPVETLLKYWNGGKP